MRIFSLVLSVASASQCDVSIEKGKVRWTDYKNDPEDKCVWIDANLKYELRMTAKNTDPWVDAPPDGTERCAIERGTCDCNGLLWFGTGTGFTNAATNGNTVCSQDSFQHGPAFAKNKDCYCEERNVVELTEEQCLEAAVKKYGDKVTANREILAVTPTGWGHVPPGCSVQSGGDWAAHFNHKPNGKNDGTYTVVTGLPETVSFVFRGQEDGAKEVLVELPFNEDGFYDLSPFDLTDKSGMMTIRSNQPYRAMRLWPKMMDRSDLDASMIASFKLQKINDGHDTKSSEHLYWVMLKAAETPEDEWPKTLDVLIGTITHSMQLSANTKNSIQPQYSKRMKFSDIGSVGGAYDKDSTGETFPMILDPELKFKNETGHGILNRQHTFTYSKETGFDVTAPHGSVTRVHLGIDACTNGQQIGTAITDKTRLEVAGHLCQNPSEMELTLPNRHKLFFDPPDSTTCIARLNADKSKKALRNGENPKCFQLFKDDWSPNVCYFSTFKTSSSLRWLEENKWRNDKLTTLNCDGTTGEFDDEIIMKAFATVLDHDDPMDFAFTDNEKLVFNIQTDGTGDLCTFVDEVVMNVSSNIMRFSVDDFLSNLKRGTAQSSDAGDSMCRVSNDEECFEDFNNAICEKEENNQVRTSVNPAHFFRFDKPTEVDFHLRGHVDLCCANAPTRRRLLESDEQEKWGARLHATYYPYDAYHGGHYQGGLYHSNNARYYEDPNSLWGVVLLFIVIGAFVFCASSSNTWWGSRTNVVRSHASLRGDHMQQMTTVHHYRQV